MVGGGIAGLGAAWLLEPAHDVHLFERADYVGGHTQTHRVETEKGPIALDSGFIVYNEHTYPLLTALLEELEVESQDTNMSFSVSCRSCSLVYSGLGASGVFADARNVVRPRFLKLLADIQKLHLAGRSASLGRALGMENGRAAPTDRRDIEWLAGSIDGSGELGRHYVLPLASALWSTGIPDVRRLPARMFVDFFRRHRLFQVRGRLPWRSIVGGSQTYVAAMSRRLEDRIHTGCAVRAVSRSSSEARVHFGDGSSQPFDRVILATHADEALRLLVGPTARERELLGAWRYAHSATWLHSDPSVLDARPAAHASWNYHLEDCHAPADGTTMTYNLNRLQRLETETPYLVTLNPRRPPSAPLEEIGYRHPVYTIESYASQPEIAAMNGQERTFFCGAYLGFGFHEDAFRSAVDVAEELGSSFA
ncbi:MAG: FAD-dependent oxidoreductase [Gemmatimonadetes bacterium]|nr:FAD-dependent oxidoreductase [Gemmatimonadota bacterium]